jgi:hypothetical protein
MLPLMARGAAMLALYSTFEALVWRWLVRPFLALLAARYVYAFILWVFKIDPGLWLATSLPGPTTHGLIELGRWSVMGAPALMLLLMHEARRNSDFYAAQRNALLYEVRPQTQRPKRAIKRVAPVVPDRPIRYLFEHIHPAPYRTFLEKERVGHQVMEKFSSGALRVWGREIVDSKRMPLAEIPKEAWRSSRFTYWFLDGGDASTDICHMECDGPQRAPRLYCDLQVNRGQLESVWPRRATR